MDQIYGPQDLNKQSDYVTDEILSMMFFSDIHDHPLFPYRTNHIFKDFKEKYPFNKPLGIDTSEKGVETFLDNLISHIEEYYLKDVILNLQKPVKVDALAELAQLQFYEDTSAYHNFSHFEEIVPNEVFYSLEQIRKHIYDNADPQFRITEEEKTNKIHNTFIHDKMLFDSFNNALNQLSRRKEEACPWTTSTKKINQRKYDHCSAMVLLTRTKHIVLEWNKIAAGTNKVPPIDSQNSNMDDIFAPPPPGPSSEERNQQLREEKLNTLLTKDINDEDSNWLKYED